MPNSCYKIDSSYPLNLPLSHARMKSVPFPSLPNKYGRPCLATCYLINEKCDSESHDLRLCYTSNTDQKHYSANSDQIPILCMVNLTSSPSLTIIMISKSKDSFWKIILQGGEFVRVPPNSDLR